MVTRFTFECQFKDYGGVKLAKIAHPDKHVHSGYCIGFDLHSKFSSPDVSVGKNIIIFRAVHIDDKKKDTLILGIGLTQKLDDTTLKAEAKYSINFSKSNKKFV